MYKKCVAVVVVLFTTVTGYPNYRDGIPNGRFVPHPCKPNHVWKGVGHENPGGRGITNPFGKDWTANGKKWDECLCTRDSDGDGLTNGEELGDPYCQWTPGDVPLFNQGLSHPGVCEPLDSDQCKEKNDWDIDCSFPELECDEIDQTEDVRNITLQLSPTEVPAEEAVYMCQGMEIPSDTTFHMIASKPLIDNANVVHGIVVFKCMGDAAEDARWRYAEPVVCERGPSPCIHLLATWTVGVSGSCLSLDNGVLMGQGNSEYVVLQMQWKNPELRSDYVDSSGIVLYYTPHLRAHNVATSTLVEAYLQLPPGYAEIEQEGRCPKECTEHLYEENIYITDILPHMHYLGLSLTVKHWRDGEEYATLVEETRYNYGDRKLYTFDPAVEIQPGDELTVSCTFDTRGQSSYVFFGETTAEEVCVAVITSYPEQPLPGHCSAVGDAGFCGDISVATGNAQACLEQSWQFFSYQFGVALTSLYSKCDPSGLSCWDGCKELIAELRTQHACLHHDGDEVLKNTIRYVADLDNTFVLLWISCDEKPEPENIAIDFGDDDSSVCVVYPNSATNVKVSVLALVVLFALQMFY